MAATDTAAPTESEDQVGDSRAGPVAWLRAQWEDLGAWMRDDQPSLTTRIERITAGDFTTTERSTMILLWWTRTVHAWFRLWGWASLTPGRFGVVAGTVALLLEGLSRIPLLGRVVPDFLLIGWWVGKMWQLILGVVSWISTHISTIGAVIGSVVLVVVIGWGLVGWARRRHHQRVERRQHARPAEPQQGQPTAWEVTA